MNRNTILGTLGVSLLLILIWLVSQEEAGSLHSTKNNNNFAPSKLIVSQTDMATKTNQIVSANNSFGFNLFSQIQTRQPTENVMISPSSIALALAMTRNGTSGETLREMTEVLQFNQLETKTIDASYSKLIETLKTADSDVQLAIANSLWVNQNIALKKEFIDNAKNFYQAEVANLNFANSTAKNTINKWVAQNTANKIPGIIDSTSPQDALYLINAIYFKGSWTNKFDPNSTTEQSFQINPNVSIPKMMMSQTGNYRYYANEQFQAVRLPYGKKEELSMYIFLPRETNNLEQFNQQLTLDNWQEWLSQMRSQQGNITIPRFKLEYETELKNILASLGLKKMFDPSQAEFSPLTDTPVAVDEVKHKTLIEVNEEGTEAAGVTSIGIRITSATPEAQPFTMNVNRPFFFAIRDDVTETVLFMGNIVEPG
ncbi:serpin family protein [Pleurocapsa sp. PCC 7319]|uniref:serpin family protein n=1 Tax=Pleurocapsa sp. PCC 7319 TaxID=118161 RepID=UPI00034CF52E|nr:serpin family protein [Pleurocapsa sp. PCC 7319]